MLYSRIYIERQKAILAILVTS